jgi:RNA-splicing ligase RtcB
MFNTVRAMATSYGNMKVGVGRQMARKKKIKRFRAVQAVKELARERLGAPPTGKVVPHKNKKAEKHKPTLGKLLDETG